MKPMKPVEIFNCERCGAELPKKARRCVICKTPARTHKEGKHWIPLALVALGISIYSISGALYYDYMVAGYEVSNPINIFNYVSLLIGLAALALAIVRIPRTRPALKFFSITLALLVLVINIDWIRFVLSR